MTPEDAIAVRDVERVLGYKLERRTLPDFDYRAAPPTRDTEFAWDPKPVRGARRPTTAALPTSTGGNPSPSPRRGGVLTPPTSGQRTRGNHSAW